MLAISGTVQLAIAMLTTAIPRVSWTVSVAMFLAPRPLHGLQPIPKRSGQWNDEAPPGLLLLQPDCNAIVLDPSHMQNI